MQDMTFELEELYYRLRDRKPEPCTVHEWAEFLSSGERQVAVTHLSSDVTVSTVFIGISPTVFETMIFRGRRADTQVHSSTWEDAEGVHAELVALVESDGENEQ